MANDVLEFKGEVRLTVPDLDKAEQEISALHFAMKRWITKHEVIPSEILCQIIVKYEKQESDG